MAELILVCGLLIVAAISFTAGWWCKPPVHIAGTRTHTTERIHIAVNPLSVDETKFCRDMLIERMNQLRNSSDVNVGNIERSLSDIRACKTIINKLEKAER